MKRKKKNNNADNTMNIRRFVYVVTEEGEYDKCFALLEKAQDYCADLDDIYDTGSWNIIKVPIKDFNSPIY
jgi:hypothetical protein